MNYTKLVTGCIATLSLSVAIAGSEAPQQQQRAMDIYGCEELVRIDQMYPDEIKKSVQEFVHYALSRILSENPGLKNHKLESLGLKLNQPQEIAEAISQRSYALTSVARNLNCPVSYIEDDIATYLFEDIYCGQKVLETLEGVYGYTPKYLGNNSSCAEGNDHMLVDLFYDIEDL
jgi:hypothetical protein